MATAHLDVALLAGAGVLLAAVAGVRLSSRLGVPSLLLYLGLGMLLGEDVIGVRFDNADAARNLGLIALALIVAEGGLTTDWPTIRPVLPTAAALSTLGVAVSVAVMAGVTHLVLGLPWRAAIVAGAVVSSTDAAAVFATLRALRLPRRLVGVLEAESGLNDAPVVILATLLSTGHSGAGNIAWHVGYELAVGACIGVAAGVLGAAGLRRAALPAVGLYPIATLGVAIASYAAAASAGASGFLAVYVTGLILGNAGLPHRRATLGFANGVAWLAQIGLFVMLGLLVTPSRLGAALLPALAIAAALLVLARPLSVLASTVGLSRFGWAERAFVALAGLRGAAPIVLATIPLSAEVTGARRLFDVVFVLVAGLTLLQSPLLAPMARRLRLVDDDAGRELEVEAAPLDRMLADLITVTIGPRSKLHGVEVWELRLPPTAAVAFVVRAGEGFVPDRRTTLRHGDDLLVVTGRAERAQVEQRLRAVARDGRMAALPQPVTPTRTQRR
ncbi:MAG: potassium/hydrogen antiporter [Frankiaceae bacterium]|jgi:cell volume regulation protein A|nr:potassium/hydrogen antiporter [Frankiaceae bacterium]